MVGLACHIDSVKEENKRANRVVTEVAETIARGAPGLKVSTKVLEGTPKQLIVEEAERWQPDLIMLGSHGNGPAERFLLGSVAQSVAVYAPCSVEIVRNRTLGQS
jgi:nucleotide-binding universal stress UspA family protein